MKLSYPIKSLDLKIKDGSVLSFKDCTLEGELSFNISDGPFGIREYEKPSYFEVRFDFEYAESKYQYEALVTSFDLIPTEPVTAGNPTIDADAISDQIQDVVDTREDLLIIRKEKTESLRLKYSDSRFRFFDSNGEILVEWNLFNQNITDYEVVHYKIKLEKLLFLNATKLYFDESGELEDFDQHGEDFCNIKKLEPVATGQRR